MRTKRLSLASLSALFLLIAPGLVQAQTVGYGDAMRAIAQACGADAEKFCVGSLPGEGLGQCLSQHNVGGACPATLQKSLAEIQQRAAAQAGAIETCLPDAKRFCKDYNPGRGHFLTCLERVDIKPKVSRKCNRAINAAGWR